MEITETKSESLSREFKIKVPAADIEGSINQRLREIAPTVRLAGFRPGKVPPTLLRKRYGASIMGEVLEKTVVASSQKAMEERGLRPAMQPKIEITAFQEGGDLEYTMAVDLMPEIQPTDLSKIKLERLVAEPPEAVIEEALRNIARGQRTTEPITDGRGADKGDIAVIDFVGTVEGQEFAGGKAEGYQLELGSGTFLPGFEDQLIGAKAGEHRQAKLTFPGEYGASELAGKDAVFEVDVKELRRPVDAAIDDAIAKAAGFDDLDGLKKAIREEHSRQYKALSRARLKRQVLDALDEAHSFELPPAMVEAETDSIWQQYEAHRKHQNAHAHDHDHDHDHVHEPDHNHEHDHEHDHGHDHRPAHEDAHGGDEGKSDEELKAEFRELADRRVRLGILLAEIGRLNNVKVNQEDIKRLLLEQTRRYPGQEQAVLNHYQKSPGALEALRAPAFEDKVIDFVVEMAEVSEKKVSPEELMKEPEEEAKAAPEKKGKKKTRAKPEDKPAKPRKTKARKPD